MGLSGAGSLTRTRPCSVGEALLTLTRSLGARGRPVGAPRMGWGRGSGEAWAGLVGTGGRGVGTPSGAREERRGESRARDGAWGRLQRRGKERCPVESPRRRLPPVTRQVYTSDAPAGPPDVSPGPRPALRGPGPARRGLGPADGGVRPLPRTARRGAGGPGAKRVDSTTNPGSTCKCEGPVGANGLQKTWSPTTP